MRNLYKSIFTLLGGILFFGTGVQAQVFFENPEIPETIAVDYRPHFLGNDARIVTAPDGRKAHVPHAVADRIEGKTTADTPKDDVTLSINLEYDPEEFQGPWILMIHDENGYQNFAMWEDVNPVTVDVPEGGSYDIIAEFNGIAVSGTYLVIREAVEVTGPTEITLDVAEATNKVSTAFYDESGELLVSGVPNPSGGTSLVSKDVTIAFFPFEMFPMSWGGFSVGRNFYFNDVSDRYGVIQTAIGEGYENGNYFAKFESIIGVSEDVALENDPAGWVHYVEKFHPSVLGVDLDTVGTGFQAATTYDGKLLMSLTMANPFAHYNAEEGIKAWLNTAMTDDPTDMLYAPSIVEHSASLDPNFPWEESFVLAGNPVVSTEDGGIQYGSGSLSMDWNFLGTDYYTDEFGWTTVLPFHSKFTFTAAENQNILQGNNVPIAVVGQIGEEIKAKFVGRYGELRQSDFFNTGISVTVDGAPVFNGGIQNFMNNFILPSEGALEITYTNINSEIEGLEGTNTTTVSYQAGSTDLPPTLQMLQFRDATSAVTDRFTTADQGTVRLAAGDFQYDMINEWMGYFAYAEGNTVEFHYGIHGQGEWTELELTEYPEHFHMPAFGNYYEASLEDVIVPDNDTWFDVRIVCTDAAGNVQEQVISPAFHVSNAVGVKDGFGSTDIAVYPNPFSEHFELELPESIEGSFAVRMTDILGKTVYIRNYASRSAKTVRVQTPELPAGVYLLSVETMNGTAVTKMVSNAGE